MTRKEIYDRLTRAAMNAYADEREAKAVAKLIGEEVFGIAYHEFVTEPRIQAVNADAERVDDICRQIESHKPVQYIIGKGWFRDYELELKEGVLIPRPETEELVEWAVEVAAGKKIESVLDAGMGSGAIAIAMADIFDKAKVCAIDVSEKALAIARDNARRNNVRVDFRSIDILQPAATIIENLPWKKCDVIISNPPYVPASDYDGMADNVKKYEPYSAIFVADSDALIFYEAIAKLGSELLNRGGLLFFECYDKYVSAIVELLERMEYADVEWREDMFGRPRMVKAIR